MAAVRTYDAFGYIVANHASWQGPFGYAGGFGYQEDATGLRLLGHRYYDPSIGRFLTRDPIKDGRNWYGYCDNDPISFVDDNGLQRFRIGRGSSNSPDLGRAIRGFVDWLGRLFGPKPATTPTTPPPIAPPKPPVNSNLAGKPHPKKGVTFDKNGFPVVPKDKILREVRISSTGDRRKDAAAANKAADLKTTPKGYVWHHHQERGRMELVEEEVHRRTGHTGGWSIWGRPR